MAQAPGEVILCGGSISTDEDAEGFLKEAYETYSTLGSSVRRDAFGQLLKELVVKQPLPVLSRLFAASPICRDGRILPEIQAKRSVIAHL